MHVGSVSPAQPRQADANLRSKDDSAEPLWLLLIEDAKELVEPGLIEALWRNPHLCFGMEPMKGFGLFLEQGHQKFWLRVPGITTGNEDRIESRQF